MNLKKLIYILLSLLYLDLIFNLFSYNSYLFSSVINIIFFDLVLGILIHIITSLFSEKINKVITYAIFIFLWFWYSLYYVFYKVLITPFSISLFRQTDQVLKFGKNVIISIIQNIHVMLLFFLPVIIIIILRNKIRFNKAKIKNILIYIVVFLMTIGIYVGNIFVQGRGVGSAYNLYYETRNTSLNIQRLGVMSATYLDIKRALFGFDEKIEVVKQEIIEDEVNVEYEYNKQDFDFSGGSGNIQIINNFMDSEIGTKQNEYTGKFKGKNLIFIVAESFSEIGVSQEYTPTLYKLIHEGFDFENFYTSNNLSTIGGEFQALTGLYADNSILTEWRGGKNYFPYGLANVFKSLGYSTYAYHDNSAYFQDRNVYLKSQGFDNFKGCYNGLEKDINCNQWPQSDVEMMNATVSDYIDSDEPFMVYYMTVSGHFYYNFSENSIAKKNKSLVEDLDYPEEVKGYIATQIELDRAVEVLMNRLEEVGKLDDTVIVLLGDHYPYNLPIDYINLLSTYKRDSLIEANSNNLILYNKSIESVKVDKVGMSIDVLPTVLNLFGVDYDSRLIMGKDILSSAEGIAIFKDKSWVTNKGTYHASTGIFDAKEEVSDDYIDTINNIVNNRVAISRMIVSNNYYKYLFEK